VNDPVGSFLAGVTVFAIVKWLFVAGLVLYLAFSAVIIRQVGVMSDAIEDPHNGVIKLFAWAHLLMTILLLVISIIIL